MGVEGLWSTTAMELVLDFTAAVHRVEFEILEIQKTGQIVRENPLRYMH